MKSTGTALIIGGGVGGPVAAMALRKAGIEAVVYEAYAASAEAVGGMLTVAPNGLAALDIVGAREAVLAVGQPMRRTIVADGRGRTMAEFPGLADLEPSQAVWRPALHRALYEQAKAQGVVIVHDKRLIAVEDGPDSVTANFADGSTASADVLIGADGIHSTVRRLIDPAAPDPDGVPLLNFGGVSDMSLPVARDATYFVFGRNGFLGYWRQSDDSTAWFANLPDGRQTSLADARKVTSSEWLARLAEAYGADTPAHELIARTRPDCLQAFGSVEIMPRVPRWHGKRMALIGDAVHAPSPSSGQGASLAVESAIELARCLRDIPEPGSAFAAYERARRPRRSAPLAPSSASESTGTAAWARLLDDVRAAGEDPRRCPPVRARRGACSERNAVLASLTCTFGREP
jgi:2-polyprenyl-6-methoxyphenol hydroxylase-like FAD-dependent oxidoreductase